MNKIKSIDTPPSKEGVYLTAFKQPNNKYCLEYTSFTDGKWNTEKDIIGWYESETYGELYDADLSCDHELVGVSGGGIKCTKCSAWFAF